jgi:hypothetical protein
VLWQTERLEEHLNAYFLSKLALELRDNAWPGATIPIHEAQLAIQEGALSRTVGRFGLEHFPPVRVTWVEQVLCDVCSAKGEAHKTSWMCKHCDMAFCCNGDRYCFALFHFRHVEGVDFGHIKQRAWQPATERGDLGKKSTKERKTRAKVATSQNLRGGARRLHLRRVHAEMGRGNADG